MDVEKLLRREPIADRGISVVIAARNVADSIEQVVTPIAIALERMSRGYEIIVVDDGSTDGTSDVLQRLSGANKRIRGVAHTSSQGYGAALRSGFRAAKYPLVLQFDGQNQYDPAEIERMLGAINQVDIVCGYRMTRSSAPAGFRYWAYRWLLRIIFAIHVRDVDCGFRLYRRSSLRRIPIQSSGRFANAEILAKASFMNMLIGEVGVSDKPHGLPTGRPIERQDNLWREAAHVFRRPQFCTQGLESD